MYYLKKKIIKESNDLFIV